MKSRAMKRVFCIFLIVVILILAIVGGYLAYAFIAYKRIPDNQPVEIIARSEADLPVNTERTMITWNLGFGAYSEDFSFFMDGGKYSRAYSEDAVKQNINGVIEKLKAENPDIILLQEVDTDATRSYHVDERKMIEDAISDHTSVYACNYDSIYLFYPIFSPHGASKSGIITLTNTAVTDSVRRSLPIESGFRKFFDLDRCYTITHIPVSNGKQLALFNIHLSAYTADETIGNEQIAMLMEDVEKEHEKGNYVIAGGDFNKDVLGDSSAYTGIKGEDYAWAKPFPTDLIPDYCRLVSTIDAENPVLSCRNTDQPYQKGVTFEIQIDSFIVSDNVSVVSCDVLDTGYKVSDHNPVKMCFVLEDR